MNWSKRTQDPSSPKRFVINRPGKYAGENSVTDDAIEVVLGHKVNGSGIHAFGGAKNWPYLRLTMNFPIDREDLREKLLFKLLKVVDEFMVEHNLDVKNETL